MTKEDFIGYIASFFISLLVFVFLTEVLPVIYDYVLARLKRYKTQPFRDITYIQNKKRIELDKKQPEWEQEGYELSELILDNIELLIESDPYRTYYSLNEYESVLVHKKINYFDASSAAKTTCDDRLKELGFKLEGDNFSNRTIRW